MLSVKFIGSENLIDAEVSTYSAGGNVVVQLIGEIPKNQNGFEICRKNGDLLGDYTNFTSIYKEIESGLQFSTSILQPWTPPEPIPDPLPPTPEEIAEEERRRLIEEKKGEIQQLKEKLQKTDYQTTKDYEYSKVGLETNYDFVALHKLKEPMRNRIDELEAELIALEDNGGAQM